MSNIKQAYSKWAPTYDKELNPSILLEEDVVVKLVSASSKDRILDVGCGTGRYASRFSKGDYVGIDSSRNMLKVAKRKVKGKFVLGDITDMPFPDKSFDKVVCCLVISHFNKVDHVLKEMSRVLKDDGYIVLSTLHPDTDFTDFELVKFNFALSEYEPNVIHSFNYLTKSFLKAKLKEKKRVELKIDKRIKHCFSDRSYKAVKGRMFGVVFVLNKEK